MEALADSEWPTKSIAARIIKLFEPGNFSARGSIL
jgi:hypothetical protein